MKPLPVFLFWVLSSLLPSVAPDARGQSTKFTTLYKFSVPNGNGFNEDGCHPNAVVQGRDGNFYGTTHAGGPYGMGTVFKLTPGGALTVLQRFGNNNGSSPFAPLLQASDGLFYGTTYEGGTHGKGTIFKFTASGKLTTLHDFAGQPVGDGAHPVNGLIEGKDGNFYGTAQGGVNGRGVVYQMTPAGMVKILHAFTTADGRDPQFAPVIQGSDGNLYGTVANTGSNSDLGYVYRLSTSGTFDVVYDFVGVRSDNGLVEGAPGVFYGTIDYTQSQGYNVSIFKVTSDGTYTEVVNANVGRKADARSFPSSGLLLASDGNFYGEGFPRSATTISTDSIYMATPTGNSSTVYQGFTGPDGRFPAAPLIQGRNGSFYGATYDGGNGYQGGGGIPDGSGTIFNLAVSPTVTSAASASATVGQNFSYQITGSLNPTHFGALGLPKGLKVDAKTGLISGTPVAVGTRSLTLQATNTGGTGTGALKLTVTN